MTTAHAPEKTENKTAAQKHILEDLVQAAPGASFEEKEAALHSALLLAFYKGAQSIVSGEVIVPVFYGVSYDAAQRQIRFGSHNGWAPVPAKGRVDINGLDLVIAANVRGGMPLLLEGDTGTGKTLLTEKYFATILDKANYVIMTLSQNQFANNPLQPFTKRDPNDVTKTHLDKEALQKVAAFFCDELNRGQTQVLLQLAYGRVQVGGEFGEVGVPVPEVTKSGVQYSPEGDVKKLMFVGAQNPSQQKDATFTGTMQLDAALSNRLLTVDFPVITESAGASIMVVDSSNGLHGKFLDTVAQYVEKAFGTKVDRARLKEQWLSTYAYITNGKRTEKAFLNSSLELADMLALALSGGISADYDHEQALTAEWDAYISPAVRTSFTLPAKKIDPTNQAVQRLEDTVKTFEKAIMPRDLAKIKTVADIFSTIRGIKIAFTSPDPVKAYTDNSSYVTVEDIAAAATIVAKSKQFQQTTDPVAAINAVMTEYTALVQDAGQKITGRQVVFDSKDPNMGLFNYSLGSAWRTAKSHKDVIQKLNDYANVIKGAANGPSELRRLIAARAVGDLATLSGFLLDNAREVDALIGQSKGSMEDMLDTVFTGLKTIYNAQMDNPLMPDLYKHRLEKMLA